MIRFAFHGLLARRVRTVLALLGLAVAIAGLVGLVSFSIGLRRTLDATADEVGGIMVLDAKNMSPAFSRLDESKVREVAAVAGIGGLAREIISPVLKLDGKSTIMQLSLSSGMPMYFGLDPAERTGLRGGGYFERHLIEGQSLPDLLSEDVLISSGLAKRLKKTLGSPISVMDRDLKVRGIYESSNPLLKDVIVMHIELARGILELRDGVCTALFVEAKDPKDTEALAERIRTQVEGVDAMSTEDWAKVYGDLAKTVDLFLAIITSFAVVVGAIGIANTMLMSVTERVAEFGVLRATGWRRAHVLRLVLTESLALGMIGGALGILLGAGVGQIIGNLVGFSPVVSADLVLAALALSAVTGSVGGIYPAWRASSLDVVAALRSG